MLVAGKYRLGEPIGRGGVGIVHAATVEQTGARVAIKFLKVGVDDPNVVERFRREARAAARVTHPNVARVIDTGTYDNLPYTVMEFLEGRDLQAILDEHGPLSVESAVHYALQACDALAEAHVQGVVHRDMKPANLFLAERPGGTPIIKLLDFGISKMIDIDLADTAITNAGFVGSPQYMAPEQLKRGPIDGGCDIWSLGVTLFELLTDASPFPTTSLPIICVAILKDAPFPIAEHRADVPAALEAIIHRCLQKDRAARYATVADLATALKPFAPRSARRRGNTIMPPTDPVAEIESRIARFGGRESVLELAIRFEDMIHLPIGKKLDPRGAFLLSRVDGISTLDDLLDISGMPAFEALRLLCELYDQNAIAIAR